MKQEKKAGNRPVRTVLLIAFYGVLAATVALDLFIHKHAEFQWQGVPEFYALYGFASCILLVFAAGAVRKLLTRDENYYD